MGHGDLTCPWPQSHTRFLDQGSDPKPVFLLSLLPQFLHDPKSRSVCAVLVAVKDNVPEGKDTLLCIRLVSMPSSIEFSVP